MIVCHCKVVSDRLVAESIGEGACTLGQVCRATGAGQDCGSCVFSLKRLLRDTPVDVAPIDVLPTAAVTATAS